MRVFGILEIDFPIIRWLSHVSHTVRESGKNGSYSVNGCIHINNRLKESYY